MNFIENIGKIEGSQQKKAALYFKTEPFITDVSRYVHTNNWEILCCVNILNELGYIVDVIDRNNEYWVPNKKYDMFLGLGVGNSGKNFVRYSKSSGAEIRILLSMGPQPDISNELVLDRYSQFNKRNNMNAPAMRTVQDVIGSKFIDIVNTATHIFNIGEFENESYKSYKQYNLPLYHFYPSVSPNVVFDPEWMYDRKINSFLCFAGNGLICKGVDILVESFLKNPHLTLHICGPAETAFFDAYGNKIKNSNNIKYHGFIEPGKQKFNELASECSYVIFHASAEGCCTSVATAMKAGLVPIINSWTGINTEDLVMPNNGNLIDIVDRYSNIASKLDEKAYIKLLGLTLQKSNLFSQSSYRHSFKSALLNTIQDCK